MDRIQPELVHRAALPWCCYEAGRGKIALRLVAPDDVEAVSVLWGDPYDWKQTADPYRWRFAELPLCLVFRAGGQALWKAELDLPASRRLKYGFKAKYAGGDWYFSENGVEPYSAEAVDRSHNHFFYPFIHDADAPSAPAWVAGTVWYQIFPERFCRDEDGGRPAAPLENWETGKPKHDSFFGGNLAGIRQKLPWLAALGVNGLYFTPLFESPSNHKYNIQDYFAIDRQFGSLCDLKALVAEAHVLGIRVMLDAVFNHAGHTHPFWQDVLANQAESPYRNCFHILRFPVRMTKQDPADFDFYGFAWSQHMPKWNTEEPLIRKHLLDAAAFWIEECGIDGWRLDVANEVSFDFWREFCRRVRSVKKDVYIVGEVWHDGSFWVGNGLFDAVMNYPAGYAVSDCFIKKSIDCEAFTRRLFTVMTRYSSLHNRMAFNLLDSHDTDRILTRAAGNVAAVKNAFTMLFLLPSSPCIYYGTEIGMEGGADPDCRRPMIWDETKQNGDLLRFFKELIRFRKRFFLLLGDCVLHYTKTGYVHRWEFQAEGERLVAVYAEKTTRDFVPPGECVVGSPPESGELPSDTVVVYHRRDT